MWQRSYPEIKAGRHSHMIGTFSQPSLPHRDFYFIFFLDVETLKCSLTWLGLVADLIYAD